MGDLQNALLNVSLSQGEISALGNIVFDAIISPFAT